MKIRRKLPLMAAVCIAGGAGELARALVLLACAADGISPRAWEVCEGQ